MKILYLGLTALLATCGTTKTYRKDVSTLEKISYEDSSINREIAYKKCECSIIERPVKGKNFNFFVYDSTCTNTKNGKNRTIITVAFDVDEDIKELYSRFCE